MEHDSGYDHLAWFLGPKAENADFMEALVLQILRDYTHWRKNYHPDDPILVTRHLRKQLEPEFEAVNQQLDGLLARLRRNFPFYSPRYLAHELSDTLLPSKLGYLAGMLFNPNNVTPQAAPVTTELEIEACNAVLTMLGYEAPPVPPVEATPEALQNYRRALDKPFGWAHICSGGTVANIEALWVARQVRYFPLAVKDVARGEQLLVRVRLPRDRGKPDSTRIDIREVPDFDLLLMTPNEAIYLLGAYMRAFRDRRGAAARSDVANEAWDALRASKYSLARGTARCFSEHPPALLVAGTRHYSVAKAADVLGIGSENIVDVKVDSHFRLDVDDLAACLTRLTSERTLVPMAVIASMGTTEEGAVDPVHGIAELRESAGRILNCSFWLHIDAAWGGFMRTLFCAEPQERARSLTANAGQHLGLPVDSNSGLGGWHAAFTNYIEQLVAAEPPTARARFIRGELARMKPAADAEQWERYAPAVENFRKRFSSELADEKLKRSFVPDRLEEITRVRESVRELVSIPAPHHGAARTRILGWPSPEVGAAFLATAEADSITVDPHKMGYSVYPSGCVAFRNDRVRLFILQRAPYITSREQDPFFHLPPRHSRVFLDGSLRVHIDSFSPFILEGSKPGAAAAALWLCTQTIPLTANGHGKIIRQSLLAARYLHYWITRWTSMQEQTSAKPRYQFIPLTPDFPDTNIVAFAVGHKTPVSLAAMNALTMAVYADFTIETELGEREYSYRQAFFLSKTVLRPAEYPAEVLADFLQRSGLTCSCEEYAREGLVVLRAAVMNPYLQASRTLAVQDFVHDFVRELAASAARHTA
ncbi:MAG TPA: pyridoxal-dependent decarboxylase [Bryobacteraceae bacterium]|nr:pyridoxal-dependent decarboxylase [Bryobacteraceae bacterium]